MGELTLWCLNQINHKKRKHTGDKLIRSDSVKDKEREELVVFD